MPPGATVSRVIVLDDERTLPTESKYSASIVLRPSPGVNVQLLLAAYVSYAGQVPPALRKRICTAPVTLLLSVTVVAVVYSAPPLTLKSPVGSACPYTCISARPTLTVLPLTSLTTSFTLSTTRGVKSTETAAPVFSSVPTGTLLPSLNTSVPLSIRSYSLGRS